MNLTIRRARESDRKKGFDWQEYRNPAGLGYYRPYVVTIDGEPFVAFGLNREIVWQNGTESVANLVRIAIRFFDSMAQLDYDLYDVRQSRRAKEMQAHLRDVMRKAGV